jgi:leucyl/phenylalanyl-tRNA--protein transferase
LRSASGQDDDVPDPLPPTRWALTSAPDDYDGDLWALGADLEPATLLTAYRLGLFPMPLQGTTGWFSPMERAVLPLASFHASRRLHRSRRRFEIGVDTAFSDVVQACADPSRPGGWLDQPTSDAYVELHRLGWAHSVEAWDDEGLAGGVYGVAVGGLFAAESMFSRRTDASKAALWALVEFLQTAGDADSRLLDAQWPTPHLKSLGAVTVSRGEYRRLLTLALGLPEPFGRAR